jgi:hypothetical protein
MIGTAREHICKRTDDKICSFLYEVAKEVTNYRSLHSLTQQVEHQYHGRFLIELIQNAHDALPEVRISGRPSRIAIVLDDADSRYGTLLIANDGHPFTGSDFESLSQLGQSNKDPQKSIGNKGIGFRSVLEISNCPQIFSKAAASSKTFDGYCFGFNPEVVASLQGPVEALATSNTIPLSPISGMPLVDWGEQTTNTFRSLVHGKGVPWLRRELDYLSPYLLPVPLNADHSPQVAALQKQGFSTVVRLPLESAEAHELVVRQMGQIPSSVLLFLDRVDELELRSPGQQSRLLTRAIKKRVQSTGYSRVGLGDGTKNGREHGIWTRTLEVKKAASELQSAISKLPGRWPEITEIPVSIAVRIGDEPEPGVFSIYLPTGLPTGSAVNVNAPFYGNMSRTDIQFDDGYNKFVLQASVELLVDVVFDQLAGKGPEEARLIVDMISPIGGDSSASNRWRELLDAATGGTPGRIDTEQIALAEDGWRALNETSILPDTSSNEVITAEVLRRHATFDIFHDCLSSRHSQLVALAKSRYPETGAFPTPGSLAETIERVAREVLERGDDWDSFWADTMRLLPSGQPVLAEHKVLIGTDGELHSCTDNQHVFFPPRQGTDDAHVSSTGILEIPASLQAQIAFLDDQITLYKPGQRIEQTPVHAYLSKGLVAAFRIEDILSTVIKDATPELPTALSGKNAERCRDVLVWSLQLMRRATAMRRGTGDGISQLQRVPVPCRGGWYPMAEASFGEGWPDSVGEVLVAYLNESGDPSNQERMKRVLLPPDHAAWGHAGFESQDLLRKGGVFDGIRLDLISPDSWHSDFLVSRAHTQLPNACPWIDDDLWSEYATEARRHVRVTFSTPQQYRFGPLYALQRMDLARMTPSSAANLSTLILKSISAWPEGWDVQTLAKAHGYQDPQRISSVLWYFLATRPWLAVTRDEKGLDFVVPRTCWHVPASVLHRRATHFAHLHALPYSMAKLVDDDEQLAAALRDLDMPYFDTESPTDDPRLILALTAAIGEADAPGDNILLGQIRDAWSAFQPADGSPYPSGLPVLDASGHLAAVEPTAIDPLYLPDLGTLTADLQRYGKSVIAIMPDDAKRLKDWFVASYGDAITPTSELALVPFVGGNAKDSESGIPIPLRDTNLAWLATPMLTLVAFHGQGRRVYSRAFEERQGLLREVAVDCVPDLEIAIARGNDRLFTRAVPAHWDSRGKVLLVTDECMHKPSEMAPALAQMLDRNDLELPLRFILEKAQTASDPPRNLTAVFADLRISEQQTSSVQSFLQGDIGEVARLMQVLCAVLAPDIDVSEVSTAQSEDELGEIVARFGIAALDIPAVIKTARDSPDQFEFGAGVTKLLGSRTQLPRWNEALVRLGRQPIKNPDWQQELESFLSEAQGLIARAIVSLSKQGAMATSIEEAMAQYGQLPPPGLDLGRKYWVVDFQESMSVIADWLISVTGADELAGSIQGASSIEDLRSRLDSISVDVDLDPYEQRRTNQELLTSVVSQVESTREVWWAKTDATDRCGPFSGAYDDCVAALKGSFGDNIFTSQLDETVVLHELCTQKPYSQVDALHQALASGSSVDDVRIALGITDQDLANVQERIEAKRDEERRRRNTVRICGAEFDSSEDNRANLWSFISGHMDTNALAAARPLNLGKLSKLTSVKAKARRTGGKTGPKPKSAIPQRQPKAIDETIGLVGEILVFRMLQHEYGNDIVTAASWKSENSRYVFADNEVDDGLGCDFAFTSGKRTYYVEVKATAGDDETFRLGSSEIALARQLAPRKAARNKRYVFVHVKNALSATPALVVLPNPYAETSAKLFTIEEADARVRYTLHRHTGFADR